MANKAGLQDAELQNFKWLLNNVDPEERNQEQLINIIQFLQGIEYLSKADPIDFLELARNLEVRTYKENQEICKEGAMGDEVYYILRGKVAGVSVINNYNFELGVGREFGEIAVIRNEPRQSTITSINDSDIMIVKKDMYIKYCGKQRAQFVREVQNFYEENYLMRGISHESKVRLANKSFPKKFLANQTLVRQGNKADTLFFISKGGVRLLRSINKRHLKNFEINYEYKKELYNLPDIIRLDVQTLYKGSQFGEFELMNDVPICNDVVTILPTQLITFSANDLKELSSEEQQMLRNNTEVMRSNEEVMLIYLENLYWKRYKQVMVENVMTDKTDRNSKTQVDAKHYEHTNHYVDFMVQNGCYVFSGSGLRFPEVIEEVKSPFDITQPKKTVAFGKTIKPADSLISQARKKAMTKLGGNPTKNMKF